MNVMMEEEQSSKKELLALMRNRTSGTIGLNASYQRGGGVAVAVAVF